MSEELDIPIDLSLDVKGLNCPLPILKTKKALQEIGVGQVLEVFTTDPGSVPDFHAFCRQTGHDLIDTTEAEASYRFLIRKSK
ncbi:MAG: sulfurtransferase TusA family protein [Proteobacteria bacterium]|nr:sulfurtransferase TusA family protein [Pseudomonadota bacterium]MDA1331013.1 sulfurtransferase TusA family protein [Pseudomonadota bacterium]